MDGLVTLLLGRAAPDRVQCTKETCSVGESIYGYYPSKPINIIFVVLFALSFLSHVFQGIKSKSWTFTIALSVGTFLEAIGYVGRLLLRRDPFSKGYIAIQLICLTVAPAFLAAGIYLTLKHLIIIYGARFSRLAPKWYTWIFIICDIASIFVQAAGAGLAGAGSSDTTGNNIIMVGLATQVVTLVIFGAMSMDVWFRISKYKGEFNHSAQAVRNSKRFKGLLAAIITAYSTILIRCIYRIAEMAGGWKNPIMQNQVSFILLDGVMCIIAAVALNVFHPGFLFKQSYTTIKTEGNGTTDMQMA